MKMSVSIIMLMFCIMMTAMMITMIMMIEAANMYTSIHKYTYSAWILGLFCFCVFDCDDDVGFASIHTLCEFFRSFCCQNRWQGRITSPLLDHHHHGDGNIVHDDDVHNSIGNDDGFLIPTKITDLWWYWVRWWWWRWC